MRLDTYVHTFIHTYSAANKYCFFAGHHKNKNKKSTAQLK